MVRVLCAADHDGEEVRECRTCFLWLCIRSVLQINRRRSFRRTARICMPLSHEVLVPCGNQVL